MSDTPRTDAEVFEVDVVFVSYDGPAFESKNVVEPDFARELERENVALREALEISDDYINQMLHGDIELTHGQLEAWRKVIYRLRTKEAKP